MDKALRESRWLRCAGVLLFVGAALMLVAGLREARGAYLLSSALQLGGWFGLVTAANRREQEARVGA